MRLSPHKEKDKFRKLNELAREGWEYVGSLGSGLVAFRRPRTTGAAVDEKPGQVRLFGEHRNFFSARRT